MDKITTVGVDLAKRVFALLAVRTAIADFDVLASLKRAGPPYRLTPTQLYRYLMDAPIQPALESAASSHPQDRSELC